MTVDSGLTPPASDAGLDEFRALVRAAFEQALSSGKPNWQEMTSAVLKNRLLNLTNGEFTQSRYGSPTFIHLVRRVPDLLDITSDRPPFNLKIKAPITYPADVGGTASEPTKLSDKNTHATLTSSDWRRIRVRQDLWHAVMDYSSGQSYVLDPDTHYARPKASGDPDLPQVPTVSREDVALWRHDFVESLTPLVKEKFSNNLAVWDAGGGRSSGLSHPLRGPWAEFMKKRISSILHDWFKGQGQSSPVDMLQMPESYGKLDAPAAISEVVQTRHLRDYIIRAVRTMTYEELAQIPLPASVLLRVSHKGLGQDD